MVLETPMAFKKLEESTAFGIGINWTLFQKTEILVKTGLFFFLDVKRDFGLPELFFRTFFALVWNKYQSKLSKNK